MPVNFSSSSFFLKSHKYLDLLLSEQKIKICEETASFEHLGFQYCIQAQYSNHYALPDPHLSQILM